MARDPNAERMNRLELKVDNLSRALGSQATITADLMASHNASIKALHHAMLRTESPDLTAILASIDYDPERPD